MIFFPFRRELDQLFENDGKAGLKILGGAFVGGMLGFNAIRWGLVDNNRGMTWLVATAVFTISAAVGAIIVVALCLKDIVRRRLQDDEPVNVILRAFLTSGIVSLMLWISCSVVGVWLLSLVVFS